MKTYAKGDRVIVPDPNVVNPFYRANTPYGPGKVICVKPHPYGAPTQILTVELDGGAIRTIGSLFVTKEP